MFEGPKGPKCRALGSTSCRPGFRVSGLGGLVFEGPKGPKCRALESTSFSECGFKVSNFESVALSKFQQQFQTFKV